MMVELSILRTYGAVDVCKFLWITHNRSLRGEFRLDPSCTLDLSSFLPTLSNMALHPILLAPPIVLLTMAVVFGDAHRRELPVRMKVAWTLGVGILSLTGFVVVFAFDSALYRQSLLLLGKPLVVRTPYELLVWLLTVGTAFSALGCFIYAIGTRARAGRTT